MRRRRSTLRNPARSSLRVAGWHQDSLPESGADPRGNGRIPAPLYHHRLRERADSTSTRRGRERQFRSLAQASLIILGMIAGALIVVRALSAVEPPLPDSGGVVNLLRAEPVDAPLSAPFQATTAGAAFVDNPFGQLIQGPPIRAAAAIMVDLNERTILYGLHPHQRRAPASLTKIATAVVAVEQAPLQTRIQVPAEATAQPENRVGLQTNEVLSLQDLLYAMWLPSGNDAATALADGIGGESYTVAQMNSLAERLELRNTHFANPAGYDAEGQHTTPYDLAVLAADAMERFPLLARIAATKSYVIPAGIANRSYSVTNLNGLLWSYPGALGGKTGRTEAAGGNLIASAERDGRRLLVVVMGSPDRAGDAELLLDQGFKALAAQG